MMEPQENNSYFPGEVSPLNQHDADVREASVHNVAGQSSPGIYNEPVAVEEEASISGARLYNIDLNVSYEEYSINANQETDSASDRFLIGGGNEDGRRLSSKREVGVELSRQLTIGEASSSSNPQARNSEQVAVTAEDNVDIYLNLPNETNTADIGENETINEDGVIFPSNEIHQATYVARQQQNNERNVRQRTDGYFSPANLNLNARRAHVHASHQQPTAVFHNDPLSVAPPLQPPRVHRTRLFAQSLTAPADTQPQEVNTINGPINVMLPPPPERQNYSNTFDHMNYGYPGANTANHFGAQMPLNYQPLSAPFPVVPQTGAGVERLNYMPAREGQSAYFFAPPELFADRNITLDGLTGLLITEINIASSLLRGSIYNHAAHNNMPLDLEEETMGAQQGFGRFGTTITEGHILPHLRQQRHQPHQPGFPDQDENCCVCQENYIAGEHITSLRCGHYFHVTCITQWIMRKNSCPICNAIGLVALVR